MKINYLIFYGMIFPSISSQKLEKMSLFWLLVTFSLRMISFIEDGNNFWFPSFFFKRLFSVCICIMWIHKRFLLVSSFTSSAKFSWFSIGVYCLIICNIFENLLETGQLSSCYIWNKLHYISNVIFLLFLMHDFSSPKKSLEYLKIRKKNRSI